MADFLVPGFSAGAASAGLKKGGKQDLGLIVSETPATVAGVFTKNLVQAAPVVLDKERIQSGKCQAIIVNSGNANACTGAEGFEDAKAMAREAADALGIDEKLVLVASTGVIGQRLNIAAIRQAVPKLAKEVRPNGLLDVAKAIMTTDKFSKTAVRHEEVDGKQFSVAAIAKGAGMIRPDMATMLCFIVTDLAAEPVLLDKALRVAVDQSFNVITVDGDMSTNDTVLILANGESGLSISSKSCADRFQQVLNEMCLGLALEIVRDGEGATKVVSIRVKGAQSEDAAKQAAFTIAHSPLVKTAFFGQDANWGRIMAAIGRAGIAVDPSVVEIWVDDVCIVRNGLGCGKQAELDATTRFSLDKYTLLVDLKRGSGEATIHTCDMSYEYIKINAEYRS